MGTEADALCLVEALEAGGIFYQVAGGADKVAALRSVVALLPLPERADRVRLLEQFLAREALASTAVGEGVAVPHARGPAALTVPRPLIALCFLDRPVGFDALDGRPVQALFALLAPTARSQLQLLSRLSFALHDARFREAVSRQAPRDEILREARRVEDGLHGRAAPSPA